MFDYLEGSFTLNKNGELTVNTDVIRAINQECPIDFDELYCYLKLKGINVDINVSQLTDLPVAVSESIPEEEELEVIRILLHGVTRVIVSKSDGSKKLFTFRQNALDFARSLVTNNLSIGFVDVKDNEPIEGTKVGAFFINMLGDTDAATN